VAFEGHSSDPVPKFVKNLRNRWSHTF